MNGLSPEIRPDATSDRIQEGQTRLLEMIARGASLEATLAAIAHFAETLYPDAYASILLRDGDRLYHGVAPSLPPSFYRAALAVVLLNLGMLARAGWDL